MSVGSLCIDYGQTNMRAEAAWQSERRPLAPLLRHSNPPSGQFVLLSPSCLCLLVGAVFLLLLECLVSGTSRNVCVCVAIRLP